MKNKDLKIKGADFCPYYINIRYDFSELAEAVSSLDLPAKRICIVTDSNVAPLYLEEVRHILEKTGLTVTAFTIRAGEENKDLDQIKDIYEHLIINSFDRKDILVALGGGVVGDMCGFAAATYLRGIDFIQVPTTLLSQVDSSVGGKTGVDFSNYKNMVGAFHQPRLVYIAVKALKTLPKLQFSSGMAEVIKHSFIKDCSYMTMLEDNIDAIKSIDENIISDVIYRSIQIKAEVVEHDPTEQNERRLLNFGHTLGHAIEKESNFTLTHGQCVAFGCAAAAFISVRKNLIGNSDLLRIVNLIKDCNLLTSLKAYNKDKVYDSLMHDKKKIGNTVPFVLLNAIGDAFVCNDVTKEDVYAAMDYIFE